MTDPSTPTNGGNPDPNGNPGNGDPNPPNDPKALLAKNSELLGELRKLKDKLFAHETAASKAQEKELAEKERWKELADKREKDFLEAQLKLKQTESQIADAKKFSAFQRELGAAIPEKYHALVDIDQIAFDETTGRPEEKSLKDYASRFKETYPDLIKKPDPKIPNDYPGGGGATVPSLDEWKKMAKTDPKRHRELLPEIFAKHGGNLGR